jgi:hypothetical protein
MLSVARVAYIPLRALAVNVIAVYSRSRRRRRKPDRMTSVELLVKPHYSVGELTEPRRYVLRYARSFPPGYERNQHLQVAVSLRRLFRNEKWLRDHVRKRFLTRRIGVRGKQCKHFFRYERWRPDERQGRHRF